MGVKDLLAKQDTGFISFHELITRVASLDNASYQQAALWLHRLLNNPQSEYISPNFSGYTLLNGIADLDQFETISAMHCLAQAATEGEAKDSYSWGETNKFSLSDFKRFGFIEADISKYLSNHGLALPVIMFQVKPVAISQELGWRDTLSLSPTLTDREVICVLSGVDPFQNGYLDDASSADYSRWEAVVHRSIKSGDLIADDNAWDIHGVVTEWIIKPDNLFSWCHLKKITYPLNTEMVYVGQGATGDDGLCEALTTETKRINALEAQLIELDAEYQSAMNLKNEEISDLKRNLLYTNILREMDTDELKAIKTDNVNDQEKDIEISKLHEELDSLRGLLSKKIESGLPAESTSKPRLKQIRIISVLAQSLFPDPLNIPDGGKTKLENICVGMPGGLFTRASFENAWRESLEQKLVRTEKHDTYSGGGM